MNLLEQILTLVSEHLAKSKKRSEAGKALKTLQEEIRALIQKATDGSVNKEIAYQCSICGKISVTLKERKYCVSCYDKYIT